jgi:prepilin-type processing-associated H-X9-DG protein
MHHFRNRRRQIWIAAAVNFGELTIRNSIYGCRMADSYHPGHVNVLIADGSVRPVADTIDIEVWRALATRAGRESAQLSE